MDWIYWIKLVHTLVFLFASSCIFYIVYCGFAGKTNTFLRFALWIVLLIGLSYAVNGFECPLATLVHLMAGRSDVPDILFPDWFARNIMPVSTIIYLIGAVLVARNMYRKRIPGKRPGSKRYPRD